MSSIYSKNRKELAGVKVIGAGEAWQVTGKNNKPKLNPALDIVGKVDMAMPHMVLKANRTGSKTAFVEDVTALPKRTKQELVDHFFDEKGSRNGRRVAYLVRTDSKSKGGSK